MTDEHLRRVIERARHEHATRGPRDLVASYKVTAQGKPRAKPKSKSRVDTDVHYFARDAQEAAGNAVGYLNYAYPEYDWFAKSVKQVSGWRPARPGE